jgi:predicted enzyme related to lactoylglutathione lyase
MKSMLTMVTVSDMGRSRAFYRDTLGLTLTFESPDWTSFAVGGAPPALHSGGKPAGARSGEPVAGIATIGFDVDDIEQAHKDGSGKSVPFVMPPTDSEDEGIYLAVFLDPHGFALSLAQ